MKEEKKQDSSLCPTVLFEKLYVKSEIIVDLLRNRKQ